jgi:hypothetical protein
VKQTDQAGPADSGTRNSANPLRTTEVVSDEQPSFEALLDKICERLQDTKTQGSLRRIQKMEETLITMEQELDELLRKE